MANILEDIQCVGSDTRPPMLDRTDFASWQQCIRLYCRGKENEVNILKSIDEGTFQMWTVWELLAEGTEGAPHLRPERPRDIYTLINHYTNAKDIRDNVKMLLEGSELTKEDRESKLYDDFKHFQQNKGETIHDYYVRFAKLINDMRNIKMTMSRMQLNSKFMNNMLPEWGRFLTVVKLNRGLKDSDYDQLVDKIEVRGPIHMMEVQLGMREFRTELGMLIQVQQDRLSATTSMDLAINMDTVFQANDCDAFGFDVDEAPTIQTMFMVNLSSADPVYDEAELSYDSDIISEVHDHDHYQDAVSEHHKEHTMHDNVQLNHVVDSHADSEEKSSVNPYNIPSMILQKII
nr:hypothetical protein [Tanacetum cinerariifolium]